MIEASDGQAALEMLRDTSRPLPDVITVDALMPRRDGWWTVSMIRSDPRLESIPIVMVTASVQPHHRAPRRAGRRGRLRGQAVQANKLLALVNLHPVVSLGTIATVQRRQRVPSRHRRLPNGADPPGRGHGAPR